MAEIAVTALYTATSGESGPSIELVQIRPNVLIFDI